MLLNIWSYLKHHVLKRKDEELRKSTKIMGMILHKELDKG